jgi:hypothetical protein
MTLGSAAAGSMPRSSAAEHVAHDAGRIENDVHQARRNGHFAIAQLVEKIFGQVAQRNEFRAFRNPAPPLMV